MLKSIQRELVIIQKVTDLLIVLIAWWLAYYTKFLSYSSEYFWYLKFVLLLIIFQYYFFRRFGLYGSQRFKPSGIEILSTLKANTVVILFFILSIYLFSEFKISRAVLGYYCLYSNLFLVLEKTIIRFILRKNRARGRNLRHIFIIGNGNQLLDYIKTIKSNPSLGLRIKGWFDSQNLSEGWGIQKVDSFQPENIKSMGIDYIVIGYAMREFSKVDDLLRQISTELINVIVIPDMSYALIGHEIDEFYGLPIISINQPKFNSKSVLIKRIADIVLSAIGLIILSPILMLIAIFVKLSSPGPILFGQRRVGLDGREFKMWKFRSMRIDGNPGNGWTVKNDPRRTKVGTFLRSTSLDELPQLWNVLMGDMSLVGPRPEQPQFVEQFKNEIPSYMLRHKVKSGITGWAQINGWRGDTSIAARIECDIWYIKNWSILLDFKIIFLTIWKGFVNKNAY